MKQLLADFQIPKTKMWKPNNSADKSGKRGLDILADSNKRRTLAMDENRRVQTIPRTFRVEPKLSKTGEKFVEKLFFLFFLFFDSTLACW